MFLALYKKYYHTLLFIGLKEIKDAQIVKDSIQQLFLYLWEKKATIKEARNVKSYIITSFLRNLSADRKKARKSGELYVVNNYFPDTLPTPEENLIKKDEHYHLSKELMKHIKALSPRQKQLVMLKFYEGLTYEEIEQKTGLSRRTVYNKIHEALHKLKLGIGTSHHSLSAALTLVLNVVASSVIIA